MSARPKSQRIFRALAVLPILAICLASFGASASAQAGRTDISEDAC